MLNPLSHHLLSQGENDIDVIDRGGCIIQVYLYTAIHKSTQQLTALGTTQIKSSKYQPPLL